METLFALLALCEGNPPVAGGFPSQRPMTRSFDVFFYLHLNKWWSKQLKSRWFETPSRSLWCAYCTYWSVQIACMIIRIIDSDKYFNTLWRHGHISGHFVDSIHKGPVARNVDVFVAHSLGKLFNKQFMSHWFETLWRLCHVMVMNFLPRRIWWPKYVEW